MKINFFVCRLVFKLSPPSIKKKNICRADVFKRKRYVIGYIFKHNNHNMVLFLCKSQYCANLFLINATFYRFFYINQQVIRVGQNSNMSISYQSLFSAGNSLFNISKQSLEVYPQRIELSACTASGRLR